MREPVEIIEEPETAPVAEPAAEPEADAEINLSELTVAELKLLAKELGISLGGATRRDDILMAIMEADPVSEE
ncbi:MAG: Rho termination factor N-terminal domain-containing protein [Bacillota bacterium]|nr:Rho termination factor N-terminal domain-containing protein [Bacillota bacterium]